MTDADDGGQELCANLNRNVVASLARREPRLDWSTWRLGDRVFRVSPDRKQARELEPDGYWKIVVAGFVLKYARAA